MILTQLKTALRSLRRRPGFTVLNASGLTIGMTCCLLIGLFLQNELTYDAHHPHADRTYRVVQDRVAGTGSGDGVSTIGDAILPVLRESVPGVDTTARVWTQKKDVTVPPGEGATDDGPGDVFEEDGFAYADPSVFEVFAWTLRRGDPETALVEPGSVVITQSTAKRYFGDADPMGRTLQITESSRGRDLTVTGVMADPRPNSHLRVDVLVSFSTFYTQIGMPAQHIYGSMWWPTAHTYAVLDDETGLGAASKALNAQADAKRSSGEAEKYRVAFQPITDVHLYSNLVGDPPTAGSVERVYVLGAIALIVLLIASFNFVNLATALGTERTREVGVRKTIGAGRGQLIAQVLAESVVVSVLAGAAAVALTSALMPAFTGALDVELARGVLTNPWLWGGAGAIVLLVGVGAGSYPAFVLTSVSPIDVLSQQAAGLGRGGGLRKGLVVAQFAISIALLAATTIAYQQMQYVRNAELGFDEETLVSIENRGNYRTLKAELEQEPGIKHVAGAWSVPGVDPGRNFAYEIDERPYEESDGTLATQVVDFAFFDMLDVDIVAGRVFSEDHAGDTGRALSSDENHFGVYFREKALVINEAMMKQRGWTPRGALGRTIRVFTEENGTIYNDVQGRVVGVVENYHTGPLRNAIEPVVYVPMSSTTSDGDGLLLSVPNVLVQVAPGQPAETIETIRSVWTEVNPDRIFSASFVDERIESLYRAEERRWRMVGVLTGVAIFVACLGLFGLAAFAARQRTKEIGIRKALGASAASVVRLLSADFLKLVGVAIVVAAPVAYLGMSEWLEGFAYRIDLGPVPLVVAAAGALLVSAVAVGSQALRAARIDPARTLRDD